MIGEDIKKAYAKLKELIAMEAISFEQALAISSQLSEAMVSAIGESVPADPDLEELKGGLEDEFRELYEDSLTVARYAQLEHNKQAGLGLQPVDVEVDAYRTQGLAQQTAEEDESLKEGKGLSPKTVKQLQNLANNAVDETIKKNASFQDKAGIEVTVTRHYDGVGLKGGTCKWCEDREGRDVPYNEALSRGMFQRHPGCGCSLTYKSGHKKYHQADWTKNSWVDPDDTLEMRKKYGL